MVYWANKLVTQHIPITCITYVPSCVDRKNEHDISSNRTKIVRKSPIAFNEKKKEKEKYEREYNYIIYIGVLKIIYYCIFIIIVVTFIGKWLQISLNNIMI